jgi:CBS domain containing-hemolysin-like protein
VGPPLAQIAATVSSTDVWLLVAIGVLLVLAIVLAAAETALTRVSRPRAEALADEPRRGGDALVELADRPDQFVTTVVLLLLACQIVQATLVGILADRLFGVVGVVVAIAIDVVVVFVLAESAPKTWAVLNPERVALAVARPVRALALFPPLRLATRGLIGLTNLVLPGKGLKHGPFVSSEDELLAVADLGVEEGVIEEDERALIESIIEFGDTVVREVMVPRPDMVTVPAHFRVADVMEVFLLNGYSRLPVCGDGLDDVVGLAYAKDLMGAERDGMQDVPVIELARPARFVPETKRVPDMLREMQRDKFHMAIVVDEYGGTAGLVTLEDIIEELVGEIVDEFDVDDPIVEPLAGGGIRVHGRTPLDQVNDLLRAKLPEGDWDTIGGLVYDRLGHVPVEGESVRMAGWRLTAQRIQGRRIGRVSILPEPDGDDDADDDAADAANGADAGLDEPATGDNTERDPEGHTAGNNADSSAERDAGLRGHAASRIVDDVDGDVAARARIARDTGEAAASVPDGRSRPPGRGPRDDRGQVGGIEALPFGILVFVVGALLVANAWAVIDAKLAVDAAARQATRHYVEADVADGGAGAPADPEQAAVDAGLAALDAHGRDPSAATVGLSDLDAVGGQQGFTRCARATFTATYEVPALTIPWIGGFGDGIDVTSTHSELVDPYRSGVPGSAESCG